MTTKKEQEEEYQPKIRYTMPGVPSSDLNAEGKLTPAKRRWHEENSPAYPGYRGEPRGSSDTPAPTKEAEGESEGDAETDDLPADTRIIVVATEKPATEEKKSEDKEAEKK